MTLVAAHAGDHVLAAAVLQLFIKFVIRQKQARAADQMKSFIKAAEYLNFTKAAEQLFITQSAISRQIGAMEQELSCRLFTRQNSQIRLTAEGKLLYHGLSRIYADYSTLLHTLADSSSGMSGEMRLGILNDQILDPWFGELLSNFSQDRPNVRISLQRLELQKLNAGLSQGDLDIAITLFRGQDGPAPHDHDRAGKL